MKRILALVCTLALLFGLCIPVLAVEYGAELNPNEKVYQQTFNDVGKNHWAFQMIEDLVERGAINGYPDGNFYPNNIVTRQEFAKIMVMAAGEAVYPASTVSFADVPLNHWANPFVEAAKPYMTAYEQRGQTVFKPEAGALREDMAVAVVKLRGYDTRLADLSILTTMFSDVDAISVSARPYVALAVENGIISGYPGVNGGKGTFGAQRTIARCEAAAILWRAFQYGNDNKIIADQVPATPAPAPTPSLTLEPVEPSDKPTPSPAPEPVEPEKPFVAETLVKNVDLTSGGRYITMDSNDNLIYYDSDANTIMSLDPNSGETILLLDGSEATTEKDGVVYENLWVDQVFWDKVGDRLLVVGAFLSVAKSEDGWSSPGSDSSLYGVFELKNGEINVLSNDRGITLECALSDGSFIAYTYDVRRTAYFCELGSDFDSWTELDTGHRYDSEFQHGSDIYIIDSYGDDLFKYNATKGTKELIAEDCVENVRYYANNLLYNIDYDGIYVVRPTDGATQTKVDFEEDLAVLDMRPLRFTLDEELFVTSDEQYLFYDSASNAIRVIRKNPKA